MKLVCRCLLVNLGFCRVKMDLKGLETLLMVLLFPQPASTGDDRAMCFTCSVCLVCWEPTDEPWWEEHINYESFQLSATPCDAPGQRVSVTPSGLNMSDILPIVHLWKESTHRTSLSQWHWQPARPSSPTALTAQTRSPAMASGAARSSWLLPPRGARSVSGTCPKWWR